MGEMIDDTLEMEEDDELLEEADEEVEKVLAELTDGKLGLAGSVDALPVSGFRQCDLRPGADIAASRSLDRRVPHKKLQNDAPPGLSRMFICTVAMRITRIVSSEKQDSLRQRDQSPRPG